MRKEDYSVLIIGCDCQYGHLDRFIKTFKLINPSVRIHLFSDLNEYDLSDDIKLNVSSIIYRHFYTGRAPKIIKRFLNILILFKQFDKICKSTRFDIINIHFPRYYLSFMWGFFAKMCNRVILTPWGSDVLRASTIELYCLKYLYQKADIITVTSESYIGEFIVRKFRVEKNKMKPLRWGSETIDYINDHVGLVSKMEAKARLGLRDSYTITCGYNAVREQQHEKIINSIAEIRGVLPANLTLLFPVTYGIRSEKDHYVQSLKEECKRMNLSAIFYENYLSVEELFIIERASDMFIHVQTTDAGNSTIMEYCLCGSKIIHGTWNVYKWMDFTPRFYYPVNEIEELPQVISDAYSSTILPVPEIAINTFKNRGWKRQMVSWNEVFMSSLSD